ASSLLRQRMRYTPIRSGESKRPWFSTKKAATSSGLIAVSALSKASLAARSVSSVRSRTAGGSSSFFALAPSASSTSLTITWSRKLRFCSPGVLPSVASWKSGTSFNLFSSSAAVISADPTVATTTRAGSSARTVPSAQVIANVTLNTERAPPPLRIPTFLAARRGFVALEARGRLLGLERGGRLATPGPLRVPPADEERARERRKRHGARGARVSEEPIVGAPEVRIERVGVEHAGEDGDGDDERDGVEH